MMRRLRGTHLGLALLPVTLGALFFAQHRSGEGGAGFLADVEGAEQNEGPLENPDPIGRFLRTPTLDPASREVHLDSLRAAVARARAANASSEARREAAYAADARLLALEVAEDWRPLLRAELLAPLGDTTQVLEALAQVPAGAGLHARWGWAFAVQAYEAAGDPAGALLRADAEAEAALTPAQAAAPWRRAATLARTRGDAEGARLRLLRALNAGPEHPDAQQAARALVAQASGGMGAWSDSVLVAHALIQAKAWPEAIPLLNALNPLEPALRVGLGEALVETRRPAEALRVLSELLVMDEARTLGAASSASTSAAFHWAVQAHIQMESWANAQRLTSEMVRHWPSDPRTAEAVTRMAERRLAAGGAGTAVGAGAAGGAGTAGGAAGGTVGAMAGRVLDDATIQDFLPLATRSASGELLGVQFAAGLYLSGAYADAARAFEAMNGGSDRSGPRQQTAYWTALALARLGEPGLSRLRLEEVWNEDPISFYGLFAGERLGSPVLPAALPEGPSPGMASPGELEAALLRLRIHQILPTEGSFNVELDRLKDHFFRGGGAVHDFAEALIYGGFPVQGIVLGRDIHRREGGAWDLRLLRIVFPFPHREIIVREASARGLDPFFVAGLIRQESMFHASIASSAGAIGLMQLLPGTADEVGRSLGIRTPRASLTDPEINVRLGTQYLASMLRRFDGRVEDALSAYNAGPSRIQQWRTRPEARDPDVFLEFIPFRETRHYVKVVQQNQRIYTALYGCPGFTPCLGVSYLAALAGSPYAGGGAPVSILAR